MAEVSRDKKVSEERDQNTEQDLAVSERQGAESIQLLINKSNNIITFKDPRTGNEVNVTAKIIEDEEELEGEPRAEGNLPPLSVEDFQTVFKKLADIGVSWTADYPPRVIFPKSAEKPFYEEFHRIQREYPLFPYELGTVVFHSLTGKKPSFPAGSAEDVSKKVAALSGLITDAYRSEFFFKYAIKVPYFDNLDWEVVIKTYEKNVLLMPRIAYAILSLVLREPVDSTLPLEQVTDEPKEPEFITVAVNEHSVDRLIGVLKDVKKALNKAQRVANAFSDEGLEEAKTDGTDKAK